MTAFLAGLEFAVICVLVYLLLLGDSKSPPPWVCAFREKDWWRR